MKGTGMSRTISPLAGLGLAVATASVVGVGVAFAGVGAPSAADAAAPKSLSQAISEPRGHAAGDPIHVEKPEKADKPDKSHKGVDEDAAGVNEGRKKQAAAVKLKKGDAVTPDQLLSDGDRAGACTIGYGKGLQCLPTTPPSAGQHGMTVQQMPWTCAEVRTLLPAGLPLNKKGVDPAGLDSNGDGTACGTGDA